MVVTDEAAGRTIPNAFLDKVKDDFFTKYSLKGKDVKELGLSNYGSVPPYHALLTAVELTAWQQGCFLVALAVQSHTGVSNCKLIQASIICVLGGGPYQDDKGQTWGTRHDSFLVATLKVQAARPATMAISPLQQLTAESNWDCQHVNCFVY